MGIWIDPEETIMDGQVRMWAVMQATAGKVDLDGVVKAVPSKDTAKKIAREALDTNSTAEAAARSINNGPWSKKVRANHQDGFNTSQEQYALSGDYAEKAKDNRWLVVIRHPDNK